MSTESLFDLIQTPLIGVVVGALNYFQQRKTKPETAVRTAILSGIATAVLYGLLKFFIL